MKKLYIVGSGGFSKQVIEIVEIINKKQEIYEIEGIIDDDKSMLGKKVFGYKVIGTTNHLNEISKKEKSYAVIAISNGRVKEKISKILLNINYINLIHPSAVISDYTNIGQGNVICGGVIINPDCIIGDHCHINIGSTFGHDVTLDNYVTIMPGSNISGNVNIKCKAMIGTGSVIIQGLEIGSETKIGAGAVLTKNAYNKNTYVGVPAKKVSYDSKG